MGNNMEAPERIWADRAWIEGGVDFVAAGVTTAHDHPGGLTAFDRLTGWAFDKDGENLFGFDADDASAIYRIIERLNQAVQTPSAPAEVGGLVADLSVCDTGMINLPIGYGEVRVRIRKAITALTALQAENERLKQNRETAINNARHYADLCEKAEAERDAWKANAESLAVKLHAITSGTPVWAATFETECRAALAAHAKLKGST